MDFSGQIKDLFKPKERPHSPSAELSVRSGTAKDPKDFHWLEKSIPCQKACPATTDIPAYLTAIAESDPQKAYRINLRDNIFPAVLGRVCSRPCESACRHGYDGLGDSVAICFSKRSADDFSKSEPVILDPLFENTGKKIAVVGSGVAGLTAARELTLRGHKVTVYEKHTSPGGMLNQGIPEFRLPREIIHREIEQITALGVEIRCGISLGKELDINTLISTHDAVVLAMGTLKPNLLDLPGNHMDGIRHGLDFLLEVNESGTTALGKRVIVIGGGFTAMDCARTARRLGADTVEYDLKVLYRRTRDDMRVTPGELEELDVEGIPLECHATPIAYLEEEGKLSGMQFRRTGTHEEFDVPADTVLLATGQFPDSFDLPAATQNLFSVGDFAKGASSLIDAIGHAKDMTDVIDTYLMGSTRMQKGLQIDQADTTGRDREMDDIPRQDMPTLPLTERDLRTEVECGYTLEPAIEEAKRCYRCHYKFEIDQDKCIKCDWCLKARPRPECILMLKEIHHDDDGRVVSWDAVESMREMNMIWINQDECIRCGACLKACPVDAITLQKASLINEPSIQNEIKYP